MKYEDKNEKSSFHLNIHNFFIFKYFYLRIGMDILKTMLFEIKITQHSSITMHKTNIPDAFISQKIFHRIIQQVTGVNTKCVNT